MAPATGAAAEAGIASATSDFPVTLGAPYTIGSRTFVPADTLNFDEVGRALIGHGAFGSIPESAITAAHRTLPLPSYIEVTSLTSGRTILVRVVKRGPMDANHIIALSPGAAAQLGLAADNEPVRVRRVNPPEQERAALRFGGRAAERLETPAGLRGALIAKLARQEGTVAPVAQGPAPQAPATPAVIRPATPRPTANDVVTQAGADFSRPAAGPAPARPVPALPAKAPPAAAVTPVAAVTPAPVAAPARTGRYAVQVAALSSRASADAMAQTIGGYVEQAGTLFRVRTGPYATQPQARAAAAALHGKGFPQARMVANDRR